MSNSFLDFVQTETDPMYDAAIITENGIEYWHNPNSNHANNSHSATKLFIATAIGICCDRGLLTLDTKITSLFDKSEMPENMDDGWHEVTVYDALRHKTGMDEIPYNVDNDDHIEKIGPDFLKYIFSLKIMHERDTFRRYSDEAYYLLGRVIHKASGMMADKFLGENILKPLGFRQWAMALCPMGHPICGGGFFTRADDMAKLGYAYVCGGQYNGKQIISKEWIDKAMSSDFACTSHRNSDVYLKTGANGQMVAFSIPRKTAVAWHGCSENGNARNDRLLDAFMNYLDETKGKL